MNILENINFNSVLSVIKPTKEENEKVKSLSNRLISTINETAEENDIDAEAVLVGSVGGLASTTLASTVVFCSASVAFLEVKLI